MKKRNSKPCPDPSSESDSDPSSESDSEIESGTGSEIESGTGSDSSEHLEKCLRCPKMINTKTGPKTCANCREKSNTTAKAKRKKNKKCVGKKHNGEPCGYDASEECGNKFCNKHHNQWDLYEAKKKDPGAHLCDGRYLCDENKPGKKTILPSSYTNESCKSCLATAKIYDDTKKCDSNKQGTEKVKKKSLTPKPKTDSSKKSSKKPLKMKSLRRPNDGESDESPVDDDETSEEIIIIEEPAKSTKSKPRTKSGNSVSNNNSPKRESKSIEPNNNSPKRESKSIEPNNNSPKLESKSTETNNNSRSKNVSHKKSSGKKQVPVHIESDTESEESRDMKSKKKSSDGKR